MFTLPVLRSVDLTPEQLKQLRQDPSNPLNSIERDFGVIINYNDSQVAISGPAHDVGLVEDLITTYLVENSLIHHKAAGKRRMTKRKSVADEGLKIPNSPQYKTKSKSVTPITPGQHEYLDAIKNNDIVFGIGPAGTGKTYLAVAAAIWHLVHQLVTRIILVRPVVEAGEKLGFLPGDIAAKFDPYVRPLYDAMYDMLDPERVQLYIQNNMIEIAPLAYMRGRTLNKAFIILDEGQNTMPDQMKMFVTRLGAESKIVVTGDITQIDLPDKSKSGLIDATQVLAGVPGIAVVHLGDQDVVRHKLVRDIVNAYEKRKNSKA